MCLSKENSRPSGRNVEDTETQQPAARRVSRSTPNTAAAAVAAGTPGAMPKESLRSTPEMRQMTNNKATITSTSTTSPANPKDHAQQQSTATSNNNQPSKSKVIVSHSQPKSRAGGGGPTNPLQETPSNLRSRHPVNFQPSLNSAVAKNNDNHPGQSNTILEDDEDADGIEIDSLRFTLSRSGSMTYASSPRMSRSSLGSELARTKTRERVVVIDESGRRKEYFR